MRAGPTTPTDPVRVDSARGRWVLAATIGGSGVAMLDGTVVNVALARIGEDLGVGFAGLQWITNAYTLTLASLILLGGVLGDRYGRRRVFVIGAVWFAVASAGCALSAGAGMLIAARALQGVGAALLTPGSLAIISATFAREDRARAVGIWSGLGGIASAAGPFVGGWLVQIDWRWVFLINIPLAAAVVIIAVRHVPETEAARSATDGEAERGTDLVGAGVLVVALGGLTLGLTRAAATGWDLLAIAATIAGVAALVIFVLEERRTRHPLVPPSIFADRVFTVTNAVTVFVYAALGVYFFLLVIQLQVVSGWSPLAAGTSLLPATALMLLLSGRFGALSERTGPRPLMIIGSLLAAGAFAWSARIGPAATYLTDVLPPVILLGLGLSCVVAPLTAAVLAAVPDDLAGAASGVNNAVARTAGLLAIVIVPGVAGLSGSGLGDTATLARGYVIAMIIGAGLLVLAAAAACFAVARPRAGAAPPTDRGDVHRYPHCPTGGPQLHPAE